jgi:membrane protein required for beta-lactamase induction
MKLVIVLALLSVFSALACAVYFMLGRGADADTAQEDAGPPERAKKMARALAWRVGLSIALVLLLLIAYALGWIEPHTAPIGH